MFKKNKYKILRGAISKELASFVYAYFLKKRKVAKFLFDHKFLSPFTDYWGVWTDPYSYARLYKPGDVLPRHKDRYSCEVSTTLKLGGDPWPLYLDPTGKTGGAGIKVELEPGDMLLYSGCDLEHWREAFTGKDCAQVFLHYNDSKKKTAKVNKFDNRPLLGLPPYFKGFTIPKK